MTPLDLDLPDHLAACEPLIWRTVQLALERRCALLALDRLDRNIVETREADSRSAAADWLARQPAQPTRTAVLAWHGRLGAPDGPRVISVHVEGAHGPAAGLVFPLYDGIEPFSRVLHTSPERIAAEVRPS